MRNRIQKFRFLPVILMITLSSVVMAQPKIYHAIKATESIYIDGFATEPAWQTAPWSDDFLDIRGESQPTPDYRTRFKMLWDDEALYLLAELEEPHIWATLKNRDDIIYFDNDFEVFIDPDGDNHNYFEVEVNALATIFDLFMNRPYNSGGRPLIGWDLAGLECKTLINGTLNNPADIDEGWQVEMAIPWKALIIFAPERRPPKPGETWRMNFSRVQWETEISNGSYEKSIDPDTGKPLPENNWVWSPQGEINMHLPEKWGYILFTDKPVSYPLTIEIVDPYYPTKVKLLDLYRMQQQFRKTHGRFAGSLWELNKQGRSDNTDIFIEATGRQFIISSKTENGKTVFIDHQKRIWIE